jgi:hypothetical protein
MMNLNFQLHNTIRLCTPSQTPLRPPYQRPPRNYHPTTTTCHDLWTPFRLRRDGSTSPELLMAPSILLEDPRIVTTSSISIPINALRIARVRLPWSCWAIQSFTTPPLVPTEYTREVSKSLKRACTPSLVRPSRLNFHIAKVIQTTLIG